MQAGESVPEYDAGSEDAGPAPAIDVFICYATHDTGRAGDGSGPLLRIALELCGYSVFLGEDQLRVGVRPPLAAAAAQAFLYAERASSILSLSPRSLFASPRPRPGWPLGPGGQGRAPPRAGRRRALQRELRRRARGRSLARRGAEIVRSLLTSLVRSLTHQRWLTRRRPRSSSPTRAAARWTRRPPRPPSSLFCRVGPGPHATPRCG